MCSLLLAVASISLLSWGAPTSADAATPSFFSGTLELKLGNLPPVSFAGTGVAGVTSTAGAAVQTLSLMGGISGSQIVPITDPLVTGVGIVELRATAALGSGVIAPVYDALQNTLLQLTQKQVPVPGTARVCLMVGCSSAVTIPLTENGTPASASVA